MSWGRVVGQNGWLGKLTPARVSRLVLAYLLGAAAAYVTASVSQSLFVLTWLTRVGADFPVGIWLDTIWHDLITLAFGGKYVSYGAAILQGFAIAMPVAALIRKWSGWAAMLLFPLAGLTAMAVILYLLKINFVNMALVPGTRSVAAIACQLLAGALGGAVFAVLARRAAAA